VVTRKQALEITPRNLRACPLAQLAQYRPCAGSACSYGTSLLDDRAILKDFIRPAAKCLGIYFPGFGWRSFRRQNLTRIQEEGATTFEAVAQAGHSKPDMTYDYTVVSLERRKQAVLRLQERLLGNTRSMAVN
jgi:hypothetical protein